ncbi:nuclear transport factor 2 family protein [Sphingomonas bacterium]|uniref:nuclear transport factor 2 family protein n=1 Tax=Sphingomonas bacterium TaxID=1895847 RepID=UPI00157515D1|nr:nuclear transport factor 2 family protein [Sphingomonas bacterium]
MSASGEIERFVRLHALEVDYWYAVDRRQGTGAEEFYTEEGIFVVGSETMRGRDEVAAFYRWRASRGERTARHCVSNPRLSASGENAATFECVMQLFADDGVPVLESKPAIMIADVRSDCVLVDGRWLFKAHVLTPIFTGGTPATVPSRAQLLDTLTVQN